MKAIRMIHVNKEIKGRPILNDINLSLDSSRIYGFLGRNGSGKTMLFRAICGLIKPTSGEIYVFDKKLGSDISLPESLGVIRENVGFWPQYSGLENLKYIASIKNIIDEEQIKRSIARLGLDPDDKRSYSKYSLGMKQKLGIAQAIMERPDLIVLDEPTNSIDEEGVKSVRHILLEEKQRGATILIASHNKEDIDYLSDEKFKMENGLLTKYQGGLRK